MNKKDKEINKILGDFIFERTENGNYKVPNLLPFFDLNDKENTGFIETKFEDLEFHSRFDWKAFFVKKQTGLLFEYEGNGIDFNFIVIKNLNFIKFDYDEGMYIFNHIFEKEINKLTISTKIKI